MIEFSVSNQCFLKLILENWHVDDDSSVDIESHDDFIVCDFILGWNNELKYWIIYNDGEFRALKTTNCNGQIYKPKDHKAKNNIVLKNEICSSLIVI